MHRDANCRTRGREFVAGPHEEGMRAFPRLDRHIEVARRVGNLGKDRQIGGTDEAIRVCLREEIEGRLPISARCRVTRALDDL